MKLKRQHSYTDVIRRMFRKKYFFWKLEISLCDYASAGASLFCSDTTLGFSSSCSSDILLLGDLTDPVDAVGAPSSSM